MSTTAINTTPEKALALLPVPEPGTTRWAVVGPLRGEEWAPGLFVAHYLEEDQEVVLLGGEA